MFLFFKFLIFISSLAAILGRNTYPFVVEELIAGVIFYFSGQITQDQIREDAGAHFAQIY
jgi:hypothetical protein